MKKVIISPVISDFEEYRQAGRRTIEIMDDKPVMEIIKNEDAKTT